MTRAVRFSLRVAVAPLVRVSAAFSAFCSEAGSWRSISAPFSTVWSSERVSRLMEWRSRSRERASGFHECITGIDDCGARTSATTALVVFVAFLTTE
jgi:hypothetical protein